MKRSPSVLGPLLLASALLAVAAAAAPVRILFVGNSYTSFNNLPQIVRELAASAGTGVPEIKATTPGGKTLLQHLHLPATLTLIDEGRWDVVILQGQSQEAALAEKSEIARTNFLQGAAGLYDRIKTNSPQARVVLYQTWARHADYWRGDKIEPGLGDNPAEMQLGIRTWYQRAAAQRKDFIIAPVGDAWELNYKDLGALQLHRADHSHPQFNGSYLAALVIYTRLHHPAKREFSYRGSLTEAEAKHLQSIARLATK